MSISLNHTTICNLRCTMCQQAWDDIPQQVMAADTYAKVRDELFEHVSEVSLSVMGEPLAAPRRFMQQILDDVEYYDLRLSITTNATLFGSDQELVRLARWTNKMVFSIDGATKETFERVRVPARWEPTVNNITRFCQARRELPLHRRPLIYFNYVLMRSNLDELPQFLDLVRKWDGDALSAYPVIEIHPSLKAEQVHPDDPHVRAVLARTREKALGMGIGFHVPGFPAELPERSPWQRARRGVHDPKQWLIPWKPALSLGLNYVAQKVLHRVHQAPRECGYLWNQAFVLLDGRISTCCHPQFLVTGDLKDASFREIWNNRRYQALRDFTCDRIDVDPESGGVQVRILRLALVSASTSGSPS